MTARTEAQKRDAYYRKKFGVGLEWYEARFAEQSGKCGICCRPQSVFKRRFAIDHDHSWKKVPINVRKVLKEWFAEAMYIGRLFRSDRQRKKREVTRRIKEKLRAASCRGLLCPFCNRGLRYYQDDPTRLANASEYLRKHQQ